LKRILMPLLTCAAIFSLPATAAASPQPDPTPQSVAVHHHAEICPAPYHRVQVRVSVYRRKHGKLVLIRRYWVGKPYLTGGYNPKHCRLV
jgi:hypothetical protein